MTYDFTGRTAVVTGAAHGFGRAISLAFATRGAVVHACDVLDAELRETERLCLAAGGSCRAHILDVRDKHAANTMIASASQATGRVDILVNNAGGSRKFSLDTAEDQWSEALTLNFTRQRQLTHKLLDQMMKRNWGRIVNITGKSEPEGINGAFCAKAAMHSWAKGLSREVGKHGITVNSIPPGRIISEQILRNYTPEYRKWQSEHEIPVGEYGQPEDIANLVCFLASPRGRYITGTVIPVDGGLRRYQF